MKKQTKNKIEVLDKKIKITDMYFQLLHDQLIYKYFDIDSDKMLDEKIEVFQRLLNGEKRGNIENFFKILEKAPKGFPKGEYEDEDTGEKVVIYW